MSGLAGEFIQYLTTPEEYDRQHYEGGSTLYGPLSSNLLRQELAELARRLVRGEPAQAAYPLDPTNGVSPNGAPYGPGAATGTIDRAAGGARCAASSGPRSRWRGGAVRARPAGRPRVRARAAACGAAAGARSTATSGSACSGRSTARAPTARSGRSRANAATGRYRLQVRAKRYRLTSLSFRVRPSRALAVRQVAAGAGPASPWRSTIPAAVRDVDLRYRPPSARGGVVRFRVGGRTVAVRSPRHRLRGRRGRPERP